MFTHHDVLSFGVNGVLSYLTGDEIDRIAPHLRIIPLKACQVLHKQDEQIQYIFFPTAGACSLIRTTADRDAVEIASLGNESAIGTPALLGESRSSATALVHTARGPAYALPIEACASEMSRHGHFHTVICRYHAALLGHVTQMAACHALHSAEARCCRSLLMFLDQVHTAEFPLTHDALAMRLGVRRPTVTLLLKSLQQARLISHRRGFVTILNRDGLAAKACECYAILKRIYIGLAHDLAKRDSRNSFVPGAQQEDVERQASISA
jgi:CRP-like cAMP-binding protein